MSVELPMTARPSPSLTSSISLPIVTPAIPRGLHHVGDHPERYLTEQTISGDRRNPQPSPQARRENEHRGQTSMSARAPGLSSRIGAIRRYPSQGWHHQAPGRVKIFLPPDTAW